jgi:hypothetical protein
VTGGGLSEEGKWVKGKKKGYLLPGRVVMRKFRGKLLAKIRRRLRAGKLKVPEGKREPQIENLLNKLGRRKWQVRVQEKYPYGEGVVSYLARYLRGGAIKNARLIRFEGEEVSFRYQNNREESDEGKGKKGKKGKREVMELKVEEFLRRLFLHIPEPGVQGVRYYGVYKGDGGKDLEICRQELGQGEEEEVKELSWQEVCSQSGEEHPEVCEVCGRRLVRVVRWGRGGAPPEREERVKKAA